MRSDSGLAGTARAVPPAGEAPQPALRRSVGRAQLVLYGLGVTIGAGIYVLVGAAAGYAGTSAPLAFLLAVVIVAPTAASFAELSTRFPVSAGEAAYVAGAFPYRILALLTGLMVVAIGIVSAAALAQGAAGYVSSLIELPRVVAVCGIVIVLGAVALWGITQSMWLAALFTVTDLLGLALVIGAGLWSGQVSLAGLGAALSLDWDTGALPGIAAAALLAFFAFIGFEDIVNVAEEVKAPHRALPLAIFLTLVITALLYVAVSTVAVLVVPPGELARAGAPLALVFERTGAGSGALVAAIAICATLNGILIQIVMASRVVYGLASLGRLPRLLATVNPVTRTPLIATGMVVAAVMLLALSVSMVRLAEVTSSGSLVVFIMVNAALIRLKLRGGPRAPVSVPILVPIAGLVMCAGFLGVQALRLAPG